MSNEQTETLSECNKCGRRYPTAPAGHIHKCGHCPGTCYPLATPSPAPSDMLEEWQDIASAPTDCTIFMVAWPHRQTNGGWMFDFWSGKYLEEQRAAIAGGAADRSPHLFWLPTHWQPLPNPPALNTGGSHD